MIVSPKIKRLTFSALDISQMRIRFAAAKCHIVIIVGFGKIRQLKILEGFTYVGFTQDLSGF
jgi:hypothetical protein